MSRGYCYEISTDPCLYPIGLLMPDEIANDRPYGAYSAITPDDCTGIVDNLSLTTFATDSTETMSLSQIINDETELVYFDSTYYTVDEFIREVMPDTRYFVAKDNALIID